jgi:hypothetical protein
MNLKQLRKRNRELIEQERLESKGATSYWYLSYADKAVFLGGVIVRAFGFVHACQRARDLSINPGGQILGVPIPTPQNPAAKYVDKLLSRQQLTECWGDMMTMKEWKEKNEAV